MSNASYSFKENSHVIVNQGGEKKVMKKILSVALSTAMAFSMFASVAFGADAKLTPEQQFNALKEAGIVNGFPDGLSHLEKTLTRAELAKIIVNSLSLEPVTGVATYKDKGYSANHWAAPFIESATQAGILQGKDTVKGLFDPSGNVTVQELAKVLVTALKLEVPADANNTASAWAKGYVAAAVEKGFIPEGINYQAAATRSQAVVAAYAIYEANQVPTVKSYKVVDPKNVEVTMSDGEVVKVALEKALEANKETEIKFTYKDKEYTHKVTYVTTVAQTVQSVKADNLKQIVVTFDGTVEATTAENADNYVIKDKTIDSAKLSDDKTQVTILLNNDNVNNYLTNQKETELEIKNVKNEDGTKTFNQKVKFTPSDVTAPTVKEVTGLGTKAFKIKFSEPIKPDTALTSSSYKVDGKAIGASVKFAFPDTVIVETSLPVGEHNVTVSGVSDFSGLKVAPVDNAFTVAEDTAAPEVVSAKTKDLKEVTIEFNETIKNISEAYANTSNHKAKITYEDTKVKLTFTDALNYSENTITLKSVSDYSGNKADREVKVTPTLDTTRPTVSEVKLTQNAEGRFIAELRFSEELDKASAEDKENYVLKNSDGKIADVSGVNSKGNPLAKPALSANKKVVSVDLGTGLKNEDYTLTVSGVKDLAVVGNVILPVTLDLKAGEAQNGEIDRVWVEYISGDEYYVFVEFNKPLATSGDGNAYSVEKYTLLGTDGKTEIGQLTDDSSDIDLIASKTVRIKSNRSELKNATNYFVQASYIANADGKFLKQAGSFNLVQKIGDDKIAAVKNSAKAVSATEVKVEFESRITNVTLSDFTIAGRTPINYTSSSDEKTITFILDSDDKLPADLEGESLHIKADNPITSNEYGTKIDKFDQIIKDEIKPEHKDDQIRVATATGATYNLEIGLTEAVKHNDDRYGNSAEALGTAYKLFEVKAEVGRTTYTGTVTNVIFAPAADDADYAKSVILVVEFKDANDKVITSLGDNAYIRVKFSSDNEGGKNIIDEKGNALKEFQASVNYRTK